MSTPKLCLSSIEIPVENLPRAVHWYRQALGYVSAWSDDHHALLTRNDQPGSARILLVATADPLRLHFKSTRTGVIHSVIDFETDDLDAAHAQLAGHIPNLPSIPPPPNSWAPRGFGFTDSEGNRLAIFSYSRASTTEKPA